MIKFSDNDIEYLKGEAKKLYEILNSGDEEKLKWLDYFDDEDKEITKLLATKQLWDDVNSNDRINELVVTFCEGAEGMTCWIIKGMYSEDVAEFMGKQYAKIYEKIYEG